MPIYEYKHRGKSQGCADPFEIMAKISDPPLKKCPNCHKPVERILSNFLGKTNILSDANLKDKGFAKLVKNSDGGYTKIN